MILTYRRYNAYHEAERKISDRTKNRVRLQIEKEFGAIRDDFPQQKPFTKAELQLFCHLGEIAARQIARKKRSKVTS